MSCMQLAFETFLITLRPHFEDNITQYKSNKSTRMAPHSSTGSRRLKTPAHTLTRARNNQRRHRAKVREHIANLEAHVQHLELLLNQAEQQNDELRKEIQQYGNRETKRLQASGFADVAGEKSTYRRPLQSSSLGSRQEQETSIPQTGSPLSTLQQTFIALSTRGTLDGLTSSRDEADAEHTANCTDTSSSYPKASRDESTTLCSEAYATIAQQNVRSVEKEIIDRWLSRGFRAALRKGEGCRVVNCVLLGVLAAMDSWP